MATSLIRVTTGEPTVSISAEAVAPIARDASLTVAAGEPTVSISAEVAGPVTRDASLTVTAGVPTIAIEAATVPVRRGRAGRSTRSSHEAVIVGRVKSGSQNNALDPTAADGLSIYEVQVREDLSSLVITRSGSFSFTSWAGSYGFGMSFYFITAGATGGTVEFPVADATASAGSIEWGEAHDSMLLGSGDEMRMVVASSGGLGGRGARRPLATGTTGEEP